MKLLTCVLLLLMLMFLPIGGKCNPQEDVSKYFPVEAKLIWVYAGEGSEYAEFTRRVEYKQGSRIQMSECDGGTRKMLIFQIANDSVIQTFSRAEVYENINMLQELPNQSVVVLKAPLEKGSVWEDAKDRREIVRTNATITVPAGLFDNVLVVKITPLAKEIAVEYHRMEYYAAGIGLIMREFVGRNDFMVVSRLKVFTKQEPAGK